MSSYFTVENFGRVRLIRFSRPEKLNIMNTAGINELKDFFLDLAGQKDLGAVVITGSGKAFVGGADVREMKELNPQSALIFITGLHQALLAIRSLPVLVIAAVNGYALGAGCELVAACDLRWAAESAIFGMPEIKVGIPSVIEAALLVPLVGLGKAMELVLTGENINAREAEKIGLVNRVIPLEKLEEEALALAKKISGYSPTAVRLQKELANRWLNLGIEKGIEEGISSFSRAFETGEPREAMAAFLEKRLANFN